MRTEFSSSSIFGRVLSTALILIAIYIFYGPPGYAETDLVNEVFYILLLMPLLVIGTIFFSFLIGIPLRSSKRLFDWWYNRPFISLAGIAAGIFLCVLSTNTKYMLSSTDEPATIAGDLMQNYYLLYSGWFIVAFSVLHTYLDSVIGFIRGEKVGSASEKLS